MTPRRPGESRSEGPAKKRTLRDVLKSAAFQTDSGEHDEIARHDRRTTPRIALDAPFVVDSAGDHRQRFAVRPASAALEPKQSGAGQERCTATPKSREKVLAECDRLSKQYKDLVTKGKVDEAMAVAAKLIDADRSVVASDAKDGVTEEMKIAAYVDA